MKYSFKTGRLKFEAVDKMITKTRTQKKRKHIKTPALIIRRPLSNAKTFESLNKNLSKHIIKFNKRSGKCTIERLLSKLEFLNMIKRTTAYTTAVCMMLVLIYGSFASMNITFAKQVIANGKPVGIVKDVSDFETKVTDIETELAELSDGEFENSADIVYITRICFEEDVTPEEEIIQNVMATYDETKMAYALYIDDKLACAASEEEKITKVLDEYKNQYAVDIEGALVDFHQKVEIKHEYVPVTYLTLENSIMEVITKTEDEIIEYTVKNNDTVWDIAVSHDMSVEEIMSLNPDLTDFIREGDVLQLNDSDPRLQVRVSYTETVEQPIKYENEVVEDNTLNKGKTVVVKEGVDGQKLVTQQVVLLNGRKSDVNVIEEFVITEPVKGKIRVGTKFVSGLGTGSFIRPTSGTITARFGSNGHRWSSGRHTGLDIAAGRGTPIYAADSGKVTFAGWKGSYGYMVVINHNNGYETYYAHCSKLDVKVGEVVGKGNLIARMGSTGNSTGSHCHFEIRYNGAAKNPENYLR